MKVFKYHPDLHEVHLSLSFSSHTAHLSTRHSTGPEDEDVGDVEFDAEADDVGDADVSEAEEEDEL